MWYVKVRQYNPETFWNNHLTFLIITFILFYKIWQQHVFEQIRKIKIWILYITIIYNSFVYSVPMSSRWPFELKTCCPIENITYNSCICRSQWPRGLRRRSAAAHLLRSWVRIPPGAWIFVCCECSVLSGRGLCDELIIRPEESYRLWCVFVCDLETSRMRRPWPALGRSATAKKKKSLYIYIYIVHCYVWIMN